MHRFMTARVLHGYRYVDASHVARIIRSIPKTCHARPYIDCVVTYNEAAELCSKFADALQDPSIRDVDAFLATYDRVSDGADHADDAEPFTVQTHSEGTD